MLTLPPAALAAFNSRNPRITSAGVVYRNDGVEIRSTQHDRSLVVDTSDLAGTYRALNSVSVTQARSNSDMSVNNLEVEGGFFALNTFDGFTPTDVEAGLFDEAPFEFFLLQWDDPNAWQRVYIRGYIGQITRKAEGYFSAEFRGLAQGLQQVIGRTYGEQCDVKRFGDARCKVNVNDLIVTGTVNSVTSRRRFNADLTGLPSSTPSAGYFNLGELIFTSGDNAHHYLKQVKRDSVSGGLGNLELWESMPYDIEVGDTFVLTPGCDRRWETCVGRYNNGINFRGDGRWMSGPFKIIRAPGYNGG